MAGADFLVLVSIFLPPATSSVEILGIPLKNISQEDSKSLENYLLWLDCRYSSVRVSHSVWEGILGRMLIVD
jgi:hypothetical protein